MTSSSEHPGEEGYSLGKSAIADFHQRLSEVWEKAGSEQNALVSLREAVAARRASFIEDDSDDSERVAYLLGLLSLVIAELRVEDISSARRSLNVALDLLPPDHSPRLVGSDIYFSTLDFFGECEWESGSVDRAIMLWSDALRLASKHSPVAIDDLMSASKLCAKVVRYATHVENAEIKSIARMVSKDCRARMFGMGCRLLATAHFAEYWINSALGVFARWLRIDPQRTTRKSD